MVQTDSPLRFQRHLATTALRMKSFVMDTSSLAGAPVARDPITRDPVTRAIDALKLARRHVRLAQRATNNWRLEAALADIEDDLGVDLSRIQDAMDDNAADAEFNGEAQARRQAWQPPLGLV